MPESTEQKKSYVILGIHDEKVATVEENVARVRLFIGDEVKDVDIPLPKMYTLEELIGIEAEKLVKQALEEKGGSA